MDPGCEAYEYNVTTCLYLCVSSCTMDPGCEAYEYNVTVCLYLCISSCTMDPGCETLNTLLFVYIFVFLVA